MHGVPRGGRGERRIGRVSRGAWRQVPRAQREGVKEGMSVADSRERQGPKTRGDGAVVITRKGASRRGERGNYGKRRPTL